jgi:hypothetical protein
MTHGPDNTGKGPEKHERNSGSALKGPRVISYNLSEQQRPGGMKTRFKIRIETGQKAEEADARLAEALRELLQWSQQYRSRQRPP